MSLEKNATTLAAVLIEGYISRGMSFDNQQLASDACDIAYRIQEKAKHYTQTKKYTAKEIEEMKTR